MQLKKIELKFAQTRFDVKLFGALVVLALLLFSSCAVNREHKKWQLVWADEFDYNGLPNPDKWNYDTLGNSYGWGNNEAQWYTVANPNNVEVKNGILSIIARRENYRNKKYTSTRLTTKHKGDWKYGRIDVKAKMPSGNGTWPAIWMLPTDEVYGEWPNSGEIDIMEHVGSNPDVVLSTSHTKAFNHIIGNQETKNYQLPSATTAFHVYTLEWDEQEWRSYVDGNLYFTYKQVNSDSAAWPYDQRFYLILNMAIGGGLGGTKGIDDSLFPHRFEVDYVRVYKAK